MVLSFFLVILARSNFDYYARECKIGILKKKNKTKQKTRKKFRLCFDKNNRSIYNCKKKCKNSARKCFISPKYPKIAPEKQDPHSLAHVHSPIDQLINHKSSKKYKIKGKRTFFPVNTKYVSSRELKTLKFSRVLCTRENSDVFNPR